MLFIADCLARHDAGTPKDVDAGCRLRRDADLHIVVKNRDIVVVNRDIEVKNRHCDVVSRDCDVENLDIGVRDLDIDVSNLVIDVSHLDIGVTSPPCKMKKATVFAAPFSILEAG